MAKMYKYQSFAINSRISEYDHQLKTKNAATGDWHRQFERMQANPLCYRLLILVWAAKTEQVMLFG
jgi:hypothetical protein